MTAFYPSSSSYSNAWPSWQAPYLDPYDRFSAPSYYRRPAQPSRYRQPTYLSPYVGRGNDYYNPQRASRSPFPGSRLQPTRPRSVWYDDSDDEDSDVEYNADQFPCTCGKCDEKAPASRMLYRQPKTASPQTQPQQPPRGTKSATPKKRVEKAGNHGGIRTAEIAKSCEKVSPSPVPSTSTASQSLSTPSEDTKTQSTVEDRHDQPVSAVDDKTALASLKEKRLAEIRTVHNDLEKINDEVIAFRGERGSKHYLRLEDMLTKALLRLDGIEAEGDGDVRSARRAAVRAVQKTIDILEGAEAPEDSTTEAKVETQSPAEDNDVVEMDETEDSGVEKVVDAEDVEAQPAKVETQSPAEDNDVVAMDDTDDSGVEKIVDVEGIKAQPEDDGSKEDMMTVVDIEESDFVPATDNQSNPHEDRSDKET